MQIQKGGEEVLMLSLTYKRDILTLLRNYKHASPILMFKFLNT